MRGLKTVTNALRHPLYTPRGLKRRVPPPPTEAEIAERRAAGDREAEAMLVRMAANFGHPKVVDREARVAVEGDTDLNHDNVEAAQ